METKSLWEMASQYVRIIEAMEKTRDKDQLAELEEERVIWHNRLMAKLKQEGMVYKNRDHVTQIAYRIVKREL